MAAESTSDFSASVAHSSTISSEQHGCSPLSSLFVCLLQIKEDRLAFGWKVIPIPLGRWNRLWHCGGGLPLRASKFVRASIAGWHLCGCIGGVHRQATLGVAKSATLVVLGRVLFPSTSVLSDCSVYS